MRTDPCTGTVGVFGRVGLLSDMHYMVRRGYQSHNVSFVIGSGCMLGHDGTGTGDSGAHCSPSEFARHESIVARIDVVLHIKI